MGRRNNKPCWRTPWTADLALRSAALVAAAAAWWVVLGPWWRDGAGWSSAQHQRAMYQALGAWALTDAAVLIAWTL